MIQEYGDLYKLSIFMHLCCLNYVGNAAVDTGLNTIEFCSQISAIRQEHCTGGRVIHDTPDDMFDRFCSIAVSLPDDSLT